MFNAINLNHCSAIANQTTDCLLLLLLLLFIVAVYKIFTLELHWNWRQVYVITQFVLWYAFSFGLSLSKVWCQLLFCTRYRWIRVLYISDWIIFTLMKEINIGAFYEADLVSYNMSVEWLVLWYHTIIFYLLFFILYLIYWNKYFLYCIVFESKRYKYFLMVCTMNGNRIFTILFCHYYFFHWDWLLSLGFRCLYCGGIVTLVVHIFSYLFFQTLSVIWPLVILILGPVWCHVEVLICIIIHFELIFLLQLHVLDWDVY